MKAAAEVKPSVRCSGKPVVGDGSICAVSITKRAKLEEPEAADGITRRSPKLVAAYGAGIAIKRAREPEKPSNKDKGAGEKSKRSKMRAEKNKQPNGVEVVHGLSMEEKIVVKPAEFDKKGAEEKSKRSNKKRIEEMRMRIDKAVSKLKSMDEQLIRDLAVAEKIEKELAEKSKKKMKLVTHKISQAEMGHYLSDEVWNYVMSIRVVTFEDAVIREIEMSCRDTATEARCLDSRKRHIENQANMLRQYRTKGHAVYQFEVSDDERDVDEV